MNFVLYDIAWHYSYNANYTGSQKGFRTAKFTLHNPGMVVLEASCYVTPVDEVKTWGK